MRLFLTSLLVAFVVLSALTDTGATIRRVVIGIVTDSTPDQWVVIGLGVYAPSPEPTMTIGLAETTVYHAPDGAPATGASALQPGNVVKIAFRCITGTRPPCVADSVTLLNAK